MKAETAYREVVAERDRLRREYAKLALAVAPGGVDQTWERRRELEQEIARLGERMDELMTAWIAERKARDTAQPTKGGE